MEMRVIVLGSGVIGVASAIIWLNKELRLLFSIASQVLLKKQVLVMQVKFRLGIRPLGQHQEFLLKL
jgi:hypothetical protein